MAKRARPLHRPKFERTTNTPLACTIMGIELFADRQHLKQFCRAHGELLKDKVVVYKHMEHWNIHPHDHSVDLKVSDAPQEELDADVEDDVTDPRTK